MSQLVGVTSFAYAFTTLIPSWYAEKHSSVSANKAIWISTGASTAIFIIMGFLAAWAYPHVKSDNILSSMNGPDIDNLTRLTTIAFSLGTIAPGIAVRSIMLKQNLECIEYVFFFLFLFLCFDVVVADLLLLGGWHLSFFYFMIFGSMVHFPPLFSLLLSYSNNSIHLLPSKWSNSAQNAALRLHMQSRNDGSTAEKIGSWVADRLTCSEEWATFWGVILPWLLSFFFYEGEGFAHLINWTSLIVNGSVCFVVPFLVFIKARQLKQKLLPRIDGDKEEYEENRENMVRYIYSLSLSLLIYMAFFLSGCYGLFSLWLLL